MKTYISIVFAIALFVSCQEDVDFNHPELNLANASERFEQMYLDGLEVAVQSLDQSLRGGGGKGLILDYEFLQYQTFQHLEKNYFSLSDFNVEAFLSDKQEARNYTNFDHNSADFLEILEMAYSSEQLTILREFLDELFITEDYGKVKSLARNFQSKLKNHNLSEEEKLELLSVGAGFYAFADFLERGGMERIGEKLAGLANESDYNPNLRCRVDMRAVWAGAVFTGGIGAVRGGMAGCVGGTVLFPGLGTATGCVGGAVFGGATGFIEGAIGGVAGSLLLTCWR
ncbi:hypothetical protein ADIS_0238 [Lunatimonas lonarensis]|uniref:Uncharacterized protein n=1 Tax=Lunatimonas lonarensis TaxID=1232681 RepID=R7ZYV8_9BACT|nr:hypothetical protein [Lunatimonas lonarensis]EON79233.1 hypothetical protein ADIS_0238 [Lunatimonas lonarensis]